MSEHIERFEALLTQLEDLRAKLEETRDPDEGFELMTEFAEVAKAAHAELEQARDDAT